MTVDAAIRGAIILAVGAVGAACNATDPQSLRPVDFQLAAISSANGGTATSAIDITSFRLSVGEVSFGSGDQFGCVDCTGNHESARVTPTVVDVPLDGGSVLVATDEVKAGTYGEVEVSVEPPTATTGGWPAAATMEIGGTSSGAAFLITLAIPGVFRETLDPAVDMAAKTTTASVTITLPVASWFMANGVALDPETQLAEIEANARHSFLPPEAEVGGDG